MENKKLIWDYFDREVEYPSYVIHDPIPYGVAWHYVSSTFLNGFINYQKPVAIFLLDRYRENDEDISDREVSYCDKGDFGNWKRFTGTKTQLRDLITSGKIEMFHTNLGCFGDDIAILGSIEDGSKITNKFIFFYFDNDTSDCSIGKFKTIDTKKQVVESVKNHFEKMKTNKEITDYHELPLSFYKGWVNF